ncbi:DUF3179 domain-containing (seleno)protein [Microbulbifer sp. MLAF003]|uniref:DUF3179 domain-containing (seleno)protein n=1 Tax=Microbulbifer sp. MLAF003 TaxID=3032582 RepID=UPI0024ACEA2E|nr:DUF3179 domain-containing (seleno)protein [Microbulbifer sp. MLAF003]WHI49193.1 DUF3179 domain-containing (seleno)protein [Microbulbifer sp. MLAF003]
MAFLIQCIHWLSLLGCPYLSLRLFRDLADLSQWIVQTPRKATMWTFYRRHKIATAAGILWLVSALTLWFSGAGSDVIFWIISALSAFAFYSGYINPSIMMRAQQHNARYFSIAEAQESLSPGTSLIVIDANGEARGHPDDHILRPHVAGTKEGLAGENVVMTYCGLTNMGIAYTPEIDGEALDLGVMTQIENNLVMWDKKTGQPIQQFWGTREDAGPKGPRMPEWPSYRMPLWAFEKAFPNGKIFLNPIPNFTDNPFLAIFDRLMHMIFTHAISDQAKKEEPAFPTIKKFNNRLPNKTKIYGVNIGEDYVAYTKDFIKDHGGLLNVEIGGRDIVIVYHSDLDSVGAYYNDNGSQISNVQFGGESNVGKLERVETMKSEAYWVVWQNFFPETDVNRIPTQKASS